MLTFHGLSITQSAVTNQAVPRLLWAPLGLGDLRGGQKSRVDLSPSQGEQFGTEKGIRTGHSQLGAKQPGVNSYYCSNSPAVGRATVEMMDAGKLTANSINHSIRNWLSYNSEDFTTLTRKNRRPNILRDQTHWKQVGPSSVITSTFQRQYLPTS